MTKTASKRKPKTEHLNSNVKRIASIINENGIKCENRSIKSTSSIIFATRIFGWWFLAVVLSFQLMFAAHILYIYISLAKQMCSMMCTKARSHWIHMVITQFSVPKTSHFAYNLYNFSFFFQCAVVTFIFSFYCCYVLLC